MGGGVYSQWEQEKKSWVLLILSEACWVCSGWRLPPYSSSIGAEFGVFRVSNTYIIVLLLLSQVATWDQGTLVVQYGKYPWNDHGSTCFTSNLLVPYHLALIALTSTCFLHSLLRLSFSDFRFGCIRAPACYCGADWEILHALRIGIPLANEHGSWSGVV